MSKVILVRHGSTKLGVGSTASFQKQLIDRRNDNAIDYNKIQMHDLELRVQNWCSNLSIPDLILTSPYKRCRESANILAQTLFQMYQIHIPIQIDSTLGRKIEAISGTNATAQLQSFTYNHLLATRNAESVDAQQHNYGNQCVKNVTNLLLGLASEAKNNSIWCITHSSFMVSFLATLQGRSLTSNKLLLTMQNISVDEGILLDGKTKKTGEHIPQYIKPWGAIQVKL